MLRVLTITDNFRNGKYEVRNSPLNHVATFTAKSISCLKGVCYGAGGLATIAAGGVTFDQILVDAGYDPVFRPRMARIVRGIGDSLGIQPPHPEGNLKDALPILTQDGGHLNKFPPLPGGPEETAHQFISQSKGPDSKVPPGGH